MVLLRSLVVAGALSAAGTATAHVSVTPTQAAAGSYQVLRFGLGHGCEGQATTALKIEIPTGVLAARPQPKPGWTLSVERPPGEPDRAVSITWTGELPANQFDEFLILVHLPSDAGPLAFPAIQACGELQNRWVEAPQPGGPRPAHAAPTVKLESRASALPAH
ncbi:MAG: DUF1775 domain-containing protein [Phenylobacterium sp.]|uniref:YcnI family copper-binding membrane protein n=1 Tax=Phenylobacterium sp. TaxID=1871053 RepID=UPI0025D8036D|nr:YcnI family protein [Phenylobacterium sp.]MBI1197895.1 DUF1775 domain-containing protein [Phenylobacterium sp.]